VEEEGGEKAKAYGSLLTPNLEIPERGSSEIPVHAGNYKQKYLTLLAVGSLAHPRDAISLLKKKKCSSQANAQKVSGRRGKGRGVYERNFGDKVI